MRSTFLALAATALLAGTPALAAAGPECCEHKASDMKCGCAMPCCTKHDSGVAPTQAALPAAPARQAADVWFQRPVLLAGRILQGRYVIEHDNDRAARGEPCTHIYAFNDRTRPVVAFHCTHLDRERATQNIVALVSKADGTQRLAEFQFSGETAAHGVPR